MNYLQNIPDTANEYGANKLLLVRDLSIDWKHRETELFIRTPELLNEIADIQDIFNICKTRANQLRYIYHTSRSVLRDKAPQQIVDIPNIRNSLELIHEYSKVYLDFNVLMNSPEIYNKLDKSNLIVFSLKAKEKDIISYFLKKDLQLPSKIRKYSISDVLRLNKDNLVSLILSPTAFSEQIIKYLWATNYYVYLAENNIFRYQNYKTDSPLGLGKLKE